MPKSGKVVQVVGHQAPDAVDQHRRHYFGVVDLISSNGHLLGESQ